MYHRSYTELKELMKKNNIAGASLKNKTEIIELLKVRGVLPENCFAGRRRDKNPGGAPKKWTYETNNGMRKCGRRVELALIDEVLMNPSEVIHSFPSIYKAAKFMGVVCKYIK
jgi:hypothetical protein